MPDHAALIERLLADEPGFASSRDFGAHVAQGAGCWPQLLIGDLLQISLMRGSKEPALDHRITHLARGDDIVLIRVQDPAFEAYPEVFCGFAPLTVLAVDPADDRPVGEQLITHTKERAESLGAKVTQTSMGAGNFADAIIDAADAYLADMIVVGSRGLGPVRGAVLGSVSQKVLHYAQQTVVAVK